MWTQLTLAIGWESDATPPVARIALLLLRRVRALDASFKCNLPCVVASVVLASKLEMGKEFLTFNEVLECTAARPDDKTLTRVREAEIQLLRRLNYNLVFAVRHPLAVEHARKHPDVRRVYTFFQELLLYAAEDLEPHAVGEALAHVETLFSCFFVRAQMGTSCAPPESQLSPAARQLVDLLLHRSVPHLMREMYASPAFNNVMLLVQMFRHVHAAPTLTTPPELLPSPERAFRGNATEATSGDFTVRLVPYQNSS